MIPLEADFDTWGFVLVAVELRILDLKRLPPATESMSSFCCEQLEGLEKFSFDMRKKFQYATQINANSSHG
jgi:hypothetical protein